MSPRVSGHRPGITTAVLAGVVAATLGLAACGSDDADGDAAGSTTTSSSSAASSSANESTEASEAPEASESAEPDPSESAEPAPDDQPEGDRGEGEPPADAPAPEPANAPAGNAANGDDAAQITAVARGLGEDKPWGEYQRMVVDTSCRANLDQVGGRDAILQDLGRQSENTMASKVMADQGTTLPVVHGVNDIRVEGDRATANIDAEIAGQRQTTPAVYVREDGQWKTCNAA
ncbi:hypothetical protein [Corynebacterium glyciniphilum]|uniref:hypothetical protein n=1 Tax=Corynebacterium glyciniphilum TaxID=1404244 RepID=UPI0011AB547A|nr:hypothetical protein [Corynebacterium glyciniphilum]